jgi:16S rRNA C967 or C1407 C5-methylase (RsmB/RsmF family)
MPTERGAAAFEAHYAELYGGRWEALLEALHGEQRHTELRECLTTPYYLDPGSLAVARSLQAAPGQRVLDLCAAPGGKTLVLACALAGSGELVANERSSARRARLHRVLDAHLPASYRATVRITGHDATRWALYEKEAYDRVLADVPCSSERHVVQAPAELARWSSSRTKRLAQQAYAIACAAADATRPGGRLVYATCALSPRENDGVVARLIERGQGVLTARRAVPGEGWEATSHGSLLLPDAARGAGPTFLAVVEKAG